MPYPIKQPGHLESGDVLAVTFRPQTAGLVNVIVNATVSPPPPPDGDAPPPPPSYTVKLQLDIFKPGAATPAASATGVRHIPGQSNFLVIAAHTPAASGDLGGDWIARVTNQGNGQADCNVTVRYQVVPGNLGKVDHIVVLMMENRSFDHMLGYLRNEQHRTDVDGLTGNETNFDDNRVPYTVHQLATDGRKKEKATFFGNDPGHGLDDVNVQLELDPMTGDINSGFVRDFIIQLGKEAGDLPPEKGSLHDVGKIDGGDSRAVAFRPTAAGLVTVHSVPAHRPAHSESGLLAELILRRPGKPNPLKTVKVDLTHTSVALDYTPTDADLAAVGDWTCEVSNWTDESISFTTDATFFVAAHDTREQEPAGAIMGYYNNQQLISYHHLAGEFAICNRWFASLPTDTWPNRLYSLTGGSEGLKNTPSGASVPQDPPGYLRKTIFEFLQERGIDWSIFFSNLPFALIFKRLAQDAQYTKRMRGLAEVIRRARSGDLPAVSWIDPNFTDVQQVTQLDKANDDHPAGDVARGQHLVHDLYNALTTGPAWPKTLLLITYDEHGGFYDHVRPPGTPPLPDPSDAPDDDDNDPDFHRYGVRVPTFVISPWAPRSSVSNVDFDHTSLLATILRRFCGDAAPDAMGKRAKNAIDVGSMLSADAPRAGAPIPDLPPPVDLPVIPANARIGFGVVLRKTLLGF